MFGFLLEAILGDPHPHRVVFEPGVALRIVQVCVAKGFHPASGLLAHGFEIIQHLLQRAVFALLVPARVGGVHIHIAEVDGGW